VNDVRVAAVAFDAGGTFTDLALLLSDGSVLADKVLSTPHSPAQAVLTGIDRLLERAGTAAAAMARPRVIGATTVVTNAVLERKGARTALLVTEGFTDLLRIRDESRYDLYDLQLVFSEPLVPRTGRCRSASASAWTAERCGRWTRLRSPGSPQPCALSMSRPSRYASCMPTPMPRMRRVSSGCCRPAATSTSRCPRS
jgi:hypothetical protein